MEEPHMGVAINVKSMLIQVREETGPFVGETIPDINPQSFDPDVVHAPK